MQRLILAYSLLVPLFAQQNSITVTVSRQPTGQADTAVMVADVVTSLDTTRDQVLATLQGTPLIASNFLDVRTIQRYLPTAEGPTDALDWSFQITAPLRNLTATITQLTKLQQTLVDKKTGMALSFTIQGTQFSAEAVQNLPCAVTDLLADARTQAQKMASGAGGLVGPVLAMSGSTSSLASGIAVPSYALSSCILTVKFALAGADR